MKTELLEEIRQIYATNPLQSMQELHATLNGPARIQQRGSIVSLSDLLRLIVNMLSYTEKTRFVIYDSDSQVFCDNMPYESHRDARQSAEECGPQAVPLRVELP